MTAGELPLADIAPSRTGGRGRVWLLAAEPEQEAGIRRLFNPDQERRGFDYVLLDAMAGRQAIRPHDVVLVRVKGDRYEVFGSAQVDEQDCAALLDKVARLDGFVSEGALPNRHVDELVMIAFSPGGGSLGGARPRTGLEGFLRKLLDRRLRRNPAYVLRLCQAAAKAFHDEMHPALIGLFERLLADAIAERVEAADGGEATLKDLADACDRAAAALSLAGLSRQASMARRVRDRGTNRAKEAAQAWLPHFPMPKPTVPRRMRIGFTARQLFGCCLPLEIDVPIGGPVQPLARHRLIGCVDLAPDVLFRSLGSARSRDLRATVETSFGSEGPRLRAVLDDLFLSLIGLAGVRAEPDEEECVVVPHSTGAHFSPDRECVRVGEWAEFEIQGKLHNRLRYRVDFLTKDTALAIVEEVPTRQAAAA